MSLARHDAFAAPLPGPAPGPSGASTAVLDACENASEWRALLEGLPAAAQDIYFNPAYVALHLQPGARALLFAFESNGALWACPFLLSPIPGIDSDREWFDVQSAYGYGGPLANTEDAGFLGRAHEAFRSWCHDHRVVAEFVRFHPLLGTSRWADPAIERVLDRRTFSLSLGGFRDGAVTFRKAARNILQRARRLGLEVREASGEQEFSAFAAAYVRAMQRLNAAPELYFSSSYFAGLQRLVAAGAGRLLIVARDGEWLAAAVFLEGRQYLHYHLSATVADAPVPGAVNLLIEAAARHGAAQGLTDLHLGGGRTASPDDSLLRFKESMSTASHEFHIGRRVLNQEIYRALRRDWLARHPHLADTIGKRVLFYRHSTESAGSRGELAVGSHAEP